MTFRGVLRGRPPRVARVAGSWWETYLVPGCGHGYWVRTSPWGSVMVILWASQVIRASEVPGVSWTVVERVLF